MRILAVAAFAFLSLIIPGNLSEQKVLNMLDISTSRHHKSAPFSDLKLLELHNSPNTPIAFAMMGNRGEKLLLLADKASDGSIRTFTGGGYVSPGGQSFYFWYGNDGLPKYVLEQPYLYHFYNYRDTGPGDLNEDYLGRWANTNSKAGLSVADFPTVMESEKSSFPNPQYWAGIPLITITEAGSDLQVEIVGPWAIGGNYIIETYVAAPSGGRLAIPVIVEGYRASIQLSLNNDYGTMAISYPVARPSYPRGTYTINYHEDSFGRTTSFSPGVRSVFDVTTMSPGHPSVETTAVRADWKVLEGNYWLSQAGLLGMRDPVSKGLPPGYYMSADILTSVFNASALTAQAMGCIMSAASIPVTGIMGGVRTGITCGSLLLSYAETVRGVDLSAEKAVFSAFSCALGDTLACGEFSASAMQGLVSYTLSHCEQPKCGCGGWEMPVDCDPGVFLIPEEDSGVQLAENIVYTTTGDRAFSPPPPPQPSSPVLEGQKTVSRTAPAGGPYMVRLSVVSSAGRSAMTEIKINGLVVSQGALGCDYETYSSGKAYPAGTVFTLAVSTGELLKGSSIYLTDKGTLVSQTLYSSDLEPGVVIQPGQ